MFSNQGNYNVCRCCGQIIQGSMNQNQFQAPQFQPQVPQFQQLQPQPQPQPSFYEGYRPNYRENFCNMPQKPNMQPQYRENFDWNLPKLPVDRLPSIPNLPNLPNLPPNMGMPTPATSNKNGLLVFVFAEWCGHCRNYQPTWQNLKNNHSNEFDFVQAEEAKMPDDSQLPSALKNGTPSRNNLEQSLKSVRGFPTLFFISNDGKVSEIMNRNKLIDEARNLMK
jgi:thiol-disulfide isomerase/thioredoxin